MNTISFNALDEVITYLNSQEGSSTVCRLASETFEWRPSLIADSVS